MIKVKNCPFCGGKAKVGHEDWNFRLYVNHDDNCVMCGSDGPEEEGTVVTQWYESKEEAIKCWNRRVND